MIPEGLTKGCCRLWTPRALAMQVLVNMLPFLPKASHVQKSMKDLLGTPEVVRWALQLAKEHYLCKCRGAWLGYVQGSMASAT
jgi:hypothetical protein